MHQVYTLVGRLRESQNNPNKVVILTRPMWTRGERSEVDKQIQNLLVIRTLSKSCSLAGLRIGFALGQRPLIEGLERVRDSFNSYTLDTLALAGAKAAIEDAGYYRETAGKIMRTRDSFVQKLRKLSFSVLDSKANFVFARHSSAPAAELFKN